MRVIPCDCKDVCRKAVSCAFCTNKAKLWITYPPYQETYPKRYDYPVCDDCVEKTRKYFGDALLTEEMMIDYLSQADQ